MKEKFIFWFYLISSVVLFLSCDTMLENMEEPINDTRVYYRLVSVDHDRTEQISEVVSTGRPFRNVLLANEPQHETSNHSNTRTFLANAVQSSCNCDIIYDNYNGGGLLPWSEQGQVVCFRGNSQINGQLGASRANTVICVEGTLTVNGSINLSNGMTFINNGTVQVNGQAAFWGSGVFENNGLMQVASSFSVSGSGVNTADAILSVGTTMSLHDNGTVFTNSGQLNVNPSNTSTTNILQINGGTSFLHTGNAEASIGGRTNLSNDGYLEIRGIFRAYNLQTNQTSTVNNFCGLKVENNADINNSSTVLNSCLMTVGGQLTINNVARLKFTGVGKLRVNNLRKNANSAITNPTSDFVRVEILNSKVFNGSSIVSGKIDWIASTEVPANHRSDEVLWNFDYFIPAQPGCMESFGTFGAQPIILRSLAVVIEHGNTFIHWVVEKEENVDYYRIEASLDARRWEVVKEVPATCAEGCEYFISI